jgi:molecular chaperone DnaJ
VATRAKRDYYAVLGVPRHADRPTIKKAFRTLASELHPDVSGDPDADERFRELAEAYEVLSRPEARERYDQFGSVTRGVGGFQHPTFDGLLDHLPGPATTAASAGQRGADVIVEAEIDFAAAVRGTSRGLRYSVLVACEACRGEGTTAGSGWRTCPSCGGGGRVREVGSTPERRLVQYRPCRRCGATGRLVTNPCGCCHGRGRVEAERTVLVRIPPGTKDGARIRLVGEGYAGGPGGEPGDVYVEVRVALPPDAPLLRRVAAAGALCGIVLLVVTLIVFH